MQAFTKAGLDALLTPENCAENSHEPTMVINNVTALAKTANWINSHSGQRQYPF
jgi:hypothetical protein